jgi:hypothetical protein
MLQPQPMGRRHDMPHVAVPRRRHLPAIVTYTKSGGFALRISGALFLTVLIAAGYMLYLTGRDATASLDAVAAVATDLREAGVTGRELDRDLALQMINAMDGLLETPGTIPDHIDDLKTFAATAAAWADAAPSPSSELRAAVAIRKASGELRAQATRPSTVHLMRARRYLDVASDAIRFGVAGPGGPGPGLATDAVRDRLDNLQQGQQERYQELDEELNKH